MYYFNQRKNGKVNQLSQSSYWFFNHFINKLFLTFHLYNLFYINNYSFSTIMEKSYEIILPSFLRRALKAYTLKTAIRSIGCNLKRKGRSRHWILTANFEQLGQLIEFICVSEEPSWQWLVKLINKNKKRLTHDELMIIAKQQPSITVNQLMARTDCTIAEARLAIDQLEGFS